MGAGSYGKVGVGYSQTSLELVKTLLPLVPKGLDSFLFLNSGSEAIDNALKLARHATGKPNIIVFRVRGQISLFFRPHAADKIRAAIMAAPSARCRLRPARLSIGAGKHI